MFPRHLKNPRNQRGFSLVELLTVVVIIGVLASLALNSYTESKKKAFDARAKADLENVAKAQEAYFADNEHYVDCVNNACATIPGIEKLSDGVLMQFVSTPTGFVGRSSHPRGSTQYTWNSATGGMQ